MKIKCTLCALFFCILLTVKCNNIIDVDDILSENFMPSNLLILENSVKERFANNTADLSFKKTALTGTFDDAILTMGFHRSKINEYLCRNFLAEQIVAEMSMPRIKRRLSVPEDSSGTTVKENMINDEGSKNYKNWLSKSTTLEDIYRHYETDVKKRNDEESEDKEDDDEEYDSHVTGYAHRPPSKQHESYGTYGAINQNHQSNNGYGYTGQGVIYNGYNGHVGLNLGQNAYTGIYDNVNTNYAAGFSGLQNLGSYNSLYDGHSSKYHNSGSKDKDLTELLEIASTALAYLSFGMFIIHVIMCVSSVNNNTTTVVTMMPMSMNPSGPASTGGGMTSDGMMGNEGMTMTGEGSMTMTETGGGSMTMTGNGGEAMTMTGTGGGTMTETGAGSMTMTGTGGESMTMTGTGGGSMTMTGTGGASMTMTGTEDGSMTMPGSDSGSMTMTGTSEGSMTSTGGGSMAMTGTEGGSMTMPGSDSGSMTMTGTSEGSMTGTGGGSMTMTGTEGENMAMTGAGDESGSMTGEGSMTMTGVGSMAMTGAGDGSMTMTGAGSGSMTGTGDDSMTMTGMNGDSMSSDTMPGTSEGDISPANGETGDGGMESTGEGSTGNAMTSTGDGDATDTSEGATMPGINDGEDMMNAAGDAISPGTSNGDDMTGDGADGTMPGTGEAGNTGDGTSTNTGDDDTISGTSGESDTTGTMIDTTGAENDMTGTGRGNDIASTGTGNGNSMAGVNVESRIKNTGMIGIGRGLDVTANNKSMTLTNKRMTGKGMDNSDIPQNGGGRMPNNEDSDRINANIGINGMTATETIDGTNAQDNLNFRYKRTAKFTENNNYAINELARRILISIETALIANKDDGMCLRKALCDNNKYSRTLKTKSKLWIPVWSLGMSWLSGKLTRNIAPATSMLDSLKASILGLGNANCEIIYQSCNLQEERRKRKRRK